MTTLLLGRLMSRKASDHLFQLIRGRANLPSVYIYLFRQGNDPLYRAAQHSANEKVRAFRHAGVDAALVTDENWREFGETLADVLNNSRLKIVQKPLPKALESLLMDNGYDLDFSLRAGRLHPAVCEVAFKLILKLNPDKQPVTVVGGNGYFGNHIRQMLENVGIATNVVEKGDSMRSLRHVNYVVTSASCGACVTAEHLHPNHVIIDVGYVPVGGLFMGNVCPSAYGIPKIVTPVPGGTGPMQMAVLLTRYASAIGLTFGYDIFDDLPI